ncbi:MAG: cytochrome c3 family protein [Planctomycetia bacterium]
MAYQESGKHRASRIQLDYYKNSSSIDRIKHRLAWIFFLVPIAWMGWTFASGDRQTQTFSRGQVTGFHSAWNNNCSTCHSDFEPINNKTIVSGWFGHEAGKKLVSDSRCESCHTAPAHHANQKLESTPSCGGCHQEHRGLDASLVRLPDSDCTSCHANLQAHTKDAKLIYAANIASFATPEGGHPDARVFKQKAQDPGSIKFNHKLHLSKGLTIANGGKPWTFADIPEKERERFGFQKDMPLSSAVQLDCKSCHVFDPADNNPSQSAFANIPKGLIQPRSRGKNSQPIVFEIHCKSCHPLGFDDKNPGWEVPHRHQPDELKTYLEGVYTRQLVTNTKEFETPVQVRPVPLPGKNPLAQVNESLRKQVEEKVSLAMKNLFLGKKTCGECHYSKDDSAAGSIGFSKIPEKIRVGYDPANPLTTWLQEGKAPKGAIWPSIPSVWMPSAKFDHAAHRFTDCASCHSQANTSSSKDDILLPNIENCRSCHAPVTFGIASGKMAKGARHECVECHGYHHGERPYSDIGSNAWNPARTRSLENMHQTLP